MTGTGGAKSDYLSAGRALEQNRDWSAAIDAYLKVGSQHGLSPTHKLLTLARPSLQNPTSIGVSSSARVLA